MTTISLLRHGELAGGKRFRGRTDDPLTAQGLKQMETATSAPFSCELIVSSPLQRCARFAQHFADQNHLPVHIEPRFAELHFGDWEGRTAKQVYDDAPKALERFWSDPDKYPPPSGERLGDFQTRVLRAWREVIEINSRQDTLIVTHGGVIRVLLCHVQDLPLANIMEFEVGYGALFRLSNCLGQFELGLPT